MGEINAKVNSIKLEGKIGLIILIFAILWPGFSTIIAGILCTDTE